MSLNSVWETLVSWNGYVVGKKRKSMWRVGPLCLFWTSWKVRNRVVFNDESFSMQKEKTSFVFLLWSETKNTIQDSPSNIEGFIDWVGCK